MDDPPKTPVYHKSAVPFPNPNPHAFMFEDNTSPNKSPGLHKAVQSAEDLVSVTVRKESAGQKAGISLVERNNAVFVTKVDQNGLFYESEVAEGDKVLSINGKRLKKGQGASHILTTITKAKATVTMVVKKAGITPSRGSRGGKIKKRPQKYFKKALHRNKDGSLNPDIDPRILRQDEDDKDQIPIKAYKIFINQPVGVSLAEHNDMLFVTDISIESPFQDTSLEIGDRVVAVNGMNFMTYADSCLATKQAERATREIIFVVEKGHTDIPAEVEKQLQEESDPESPSSSTYNEKKLEVDDFLSPHKSLKSSFMGPIRTPRQKEKELDVDVLQTPRMSFDKSISLAALNGEDDETEESEEYLNKSVDLMDRVLKRQASNGKENSLGNPLRISGHNSWSHPDNAFAGGHNKRKGKRQTPAPLAGKRTVQSTPTASKATKQAVKRLIKEKHVDDSTDESSLEEELEQALSTLKKNKHLHNSWSQTQKQKKSNGVTGKIKKGTHPFASAKAGKSNTSFSIQKTKHVNDSTDESSLRTTPVYDSTDESSLEEDLEAAVAEVLSPDRKAHYLNSMSLNSSLALMRPEEYEGDMIRVKVKKISEESPGIEIKKTQGKFILAKLPHYEKRVNIGAHVLAINGTMNINTAVKAEGLIKQTKHFVSLLLDFSSPVGVRRNCPCCGEPMYANGEHVSGKRLEDNVEDRVHRSAVKNTSVQHSSEGASGDEPMVRTSTNKFQPGDKFMIRIKLVYKGGDPGISLFDYKGNIYVGKIDKTGSFYATPIDIGDKVLSINGKKVDTIKSAPNAMAMLEGRESVSLYVLRSDKNSVEWKEAAKRFRG